MRQLLNILTLFVTVSVSFTIPWALMGGIVGYFPAFPESWDTPTLVLLALAVAFMGGTILGRMQAWRGQILWIAALLWINAVVQVVAALELGSAPVTKNRIATAILIHADVVLLAVGMTIGLQIGARFMRPFESPVGKTSQSQTS